MIIGHCCIWLNPDGTKVESLANAAATVKHVSSLGAVPRGAYIRRVADRNLAVLRRSVERLATMPRERRMFRITSGLLPLYTHEIAQRTYQDPGYRQQWNTELSQIGALARANAVRLSFHPGQYTVLNSASEHVRLAAIKEFEYHTECAVCMGFNGRTDDFAINVHGGTKYIGSESIDSWLWSWNRLSDAARNLITLENDEMSWPVHGIERLCHNLEVRMVPDVHHHWVQSGEWLEPDMIDARQRELWHGTPKMHVSLPAPEYFHTNGRLRDRPINLDLYKRFNYALPDRPLGVGLGKLRAHSDYIYHPGMVRYLSRWIDAGWAVQVESKGKNLASDALFAALQTYRR